MNFKNRVAIPEEDRKKIAEALQGVLNPFQELNLQIKQAHWAVVGEEFQPFHLKMDELHAAYVLFIDSIAERMLALGFVPQGQVGDIAKNSALEPLPGEFVQKSQLMTLVADRIGVVTTRIREADDAIGDLDTVTDDMLTGMLSELEETLWMLGAQEMQNE